MANNYTPDVPETVEDIRDALRNVQDQIRDSLRELDTYKKHGYRTGIDQVERRLRGLRERKKGFQKQLDDMDGWSASSLLPPASTVAKTVLVTGLLVATGAGLWYLGTKGALVVGGLALGTATATAEPEPSSPIQPYVPNRPEKDVRPGGGPDRTDGQKQWQVVKIPNMGGWQGAGTYSIRLVSDIERGIAFGSFRHGGTSRENVKNLERVGSPGTRAEAVRLLAGMIKPGSLRRPPLAGGMWGEVDGSLVTIDDFGPVSIRELQQAMSGS